MSSRMGSGAGHILEGIKRRSPKDETIKDSPVDVTNIEAQSVEVKRDEVRPAEVIPAKHHNVEVNKFISDAHINVNVLQEAVDLALNKKQRISVWAPDIALIMWYLKLSTPMFSISDVAKKYIAEGLQRDYPELYKQAIEALEKNR
jgi:hypothetical protein